MPLMFFFLGEGKGSRMSAGTQVCFSRTNFCPPCTADGLPDAENSMVSGQHKAYHRPGQTMPSTGRNNKTVNYKMIQRSDIERFRHYES